MRRADGMDQFCWPKQKMHFAHEMVVTYTMNAARTTPIHKGVIDSLTALSGLARIAADRGDHDRAWEMLKLGLTLNRRHACIPGTYAYWEMHRGEKLLLRECEYLAKESPLPRSIEEELKKRTYARWADRAIKFDGCLLIAILRDDEMRQVFVPGTVESEEYFLEGTYKRASLGESIAQILDIYKSVISTSDSQEVVRERLSNYPDDELRPIMVDQASHNVGFVLLVSPVELGERRDVIIGR